MEGVCGFTALATVGYWSQIGGIGFQHEGTVVGLTGTLLNVFCIWERRDASEGD